MTAHVEIRCDDPRCHDAIDGGYVGAPLDTAIERAVKEYGWFVDSGNDQHWCDIHKGEN